MKFEPESRCGVSCAACESFLGGGCPGCITAEKECAVTACAKQKGRRFCGECGEFPCEILMEYEKQPGKAGCWLCTELDGCAKGYYGNQDEYVAKATAMFIRKHGKETYTEALRRAVEAGENYPKSFDAQGSVEAALRLLEQYR